MGLWRGVAAGLLAGGLAITPGLALAADATLHLVVGGEGFEGPPKFAVSFAGQPVGDGTVAAAIDTTRSGRFADAKDQAKYVQSFDFTIPEAMFKPDGKVVIKLTNEAHGAAGSKDDRALYVQSVAVNGKAAPGKTLTMQSAVGVEPTAMLGDYLVVSEGAVEGVAAAPGGGWPAAAAAEAKPVAETTPVTEAKPVAATAEVKPVEKTKPEGAATVAAKPESEVATKPVAEVAAKPEAATAEARPVAETVAETGPAAAKPGAAPVPASKPAVVAEASAPATAEATRPADPSAKMAAAAPAVADAPGDNPDPTGGAAACGLSQSFQITGFNENSNGLTPRAHRQLDAVVKAIGTQKCVVHVTGYSSVEGDYAHNALFSIERAQNALRYLTDKGVKYRRFSANGVGETTQFGRSPNANRRVVVAVSP